MFNNPSSSNLRSDSSQPIIPIQSSNDTASGADVHTINEVPNYNIGVQTGHSSTSDDLNRSYSPTGTSDWSDLVISVEYEFRQYHGINGGEVDGNGSQLSNITDEVYQANHNGNDLQDWDVDHQDNRGYL